MGVVGAHIQATLHMYCALSMCTCTEHPQHTPVPAISHHPTLQQHSAHQYPIIPNHPTTTTPTTVLDAASIPYDPHLLELAPSPLYRVLVDYERHFRAHCTEAEAFQKAAVGRHALALERIAEQVCLRVGVRVYVYMCVCMCVCVCV